MRSWRQWVKALQDRTLINQRKSMFQGDTMDHNGAMAGGMMDGRGMDVGAMGKGTRMGAAMCQEIWWIEGTV